MIKIGVPSRSSGLHIGGIVALIKAGLLDANDYHPAKLYYRRSEVEILLTRCDQLCSLYEKQKIDIIFTGADYLKEFCTSEIKGRFDWQIFECHFSLMCSNEGVLSSEVFTKFPNIAIDLLNLSSEEVGNIRSVSGGCELYALAFGASCFDVICTGATKNQNNLKTLQSFSVFCPTWIGLKPGCHISAILKKALIDDKLNSTLSNFYKRSFDEKNSNILESVSSLVHLSKK